MPETTTIYQISHEGIEDLKGEIWTLDNIEKIGICVPVKGNPYLVVEYKKSSMTVNKKGNHQWSTEMKRITIK